MYYVMWKLSKQSIKVFTSAFETHEKAQRMKTLIVSQGGMAILDEEIPESWKRHMDNPDDPIKARGG